MATQHHSNDLIGGRYRLEGIIASGGMANVWRAKDVILHRVVAIKMLRDDIASDHTTIERFRREAQALARLTHPHIVPVYDCIDEPDLVALVMRLIEGKSLRGLLDEGSNTNQPQQLGAHLTIHIGRAIASALAKAHDENIVHRDIKPANILIMKNGDVLLTDFGIAKPLVASVDDHVDLTKPDIMMGTAKYLSPEQVQGRTLDGRADIYSLGLVLYECLAGKAPFRGENEQQTAIARLQRDPTPLSGIRSDVPSNLISVIHKMLQRKPEHRFANCHDVVRALDEVTQQNHDALTPVDGLSTSMVPATTRRAPTLHDPLIPQRTPRSLRPVEDDFTPTDVVETKDKTPRGLARAQTSLPRGQQTSVKRNYIPIALLLVAALVMAVMLWRGLQSTKSEVGSSPVVAEIPVGPVTVIGLRSYDPNGDDGQENEAMIPALTDNNPATTWTTVCYGNQYFGSKGGVGVILQLSGVGLGTLAANFATAPWNAEIYVSTSEAIPASLDGWGLRVANANSQETGIGTFEVKTPARNVLLYMREAGRSTSCSDSNPFKGSLSSVDFTSAK